MVRDGGSLWLLPVQWQLFKQHLMCDRGYDMFRLIHKRISLLVIMRHDKLPFNICMGGLLSIGLD
jgi:hypothetical protein